MVLAALVAFLMSGFLHAPPMCRYGIHMHVIWNSPGCHEREGGHTMGGGILRY